MKLKSAYRFQLSEHKKPISIFYFVILCLFALSIIIAFNSKDSETGNNGVELSTAIFLFVCGIVGFKDTFGMMVQNSVSRKSMFVSRLLATGTIALFMALVDKLLGTIMETIALSDSIKFSTTSFIEMLYPKQAEELNSFLFAVLTVVLLAFMYLAAISVGYFLATLFYRLNKIGKVIIAVSLPASVVFLLPIIDEVFADGKITKWIIDFLNFILGVTKNQPINAVLSFTVIFAVFSSLSWLLLRKAVVKD